MTRGQRREPGVISLLAGIFTDLPLLPGARCIGSGDLFDPRANGESVQAAQYRHNQAAALCAQCCVLADCRSWADTQPGQRSAVIGGRLPDQPGRPRKEGNSRMNEQRHRDRKERKKVCKRCYGPCRTHKGTVHGWTCEACLRDYVDAQLPKGAA